MYPWAAKKNWSTRFVFYVPKRDIFSARGQMSELRSKCQIRRIEEQRGNYIQIRAMINGSYMILQCQD